MIGAPHADAFDAEAFSARFGTEVAQLVNGVARMGAIKAIPDDAPAHDRDAHSESLRKMLLAMVGDIRVVLIKLAGAYAGAALPGLAQGRGWRAGARVRRRICSRRSPTGSACGSSNGSSRISVCARSSRRPTSRSPSCSTSAASTASSTSKSVKATLKRELAAAGVTAEISGRPKHIHSIWTKMRRKQAGIDELYDIRAVRILVDEVKDCYTALGLVHNLWTPMVKEFDDYIARPKANDYRSLHTAVIGPRGQAARGADPHARNAPALGIRRRRALALQGRRAASAAATRVTTRRSPGCGRCSTGRMRSPMRANGCSSSNRACSRKPSTC